MTLLAPLFFYAALGVAAATVALHFIVTRQPTSSALPTVRFVPQGTVRVVTFSRPRDLLLLFLRVLLILLVGLAFARPILVPERRPVARIVLADISRRVADTEEVRDSALALLGPGDVLVPFDTEARVIRHGSVDSLTHLERSAREGRLSAALVAALRAAPELRDQADSIEIAIISPLRAEQVDAATAEIRALWPGRIRLVSVSATTDTLQVSSGITIRADSDDDGVALAARLAGLTGARDAAAGDVQVRIVRGAVTAEDSAWVSAGRRTLVRWPAEGAPQGWRERARPDTAGAVVVGAAALVYPLERRWELGGEVDLTAGDASADAAGRSGGQAEYRVAARWVDGEPAAIERQVGAGCIRDVAIPVPDRGDLAFRPAFAQLVRTLALPCEVTVGSTALDATALETLAGSGPLAPSDALPAPEVVASPLVPWLLALAILLALAELLVRRSSRGRGVVALDGRDNREQEVMVPASGEVS